MPAKKKKPKVKVSNKPKPSPNSERVVVDEIFDDGVARILRAKHLPDVVSETKFSIDTWGEETEDFIKAWRLEAFVGFSGKQSLKEGDVFFVVDGTKLNDTYKPIRREIAEKQHLLCPWGESRELARQEIKKQFYKLSASQMATKAKERDTLINRVEKKFKTDTSTAE